MHLLYYYTHPVKTSLRSPHLPLLQPAMRLLYCLLTPSPPKASQAQHRLYE
jgi:hypothetical protein